MHGVTSHAIVVLRDYYSSQTTKCLVVFSNFGNSRYILHERFATTSGLAG